MFNTVAKYIWGDNSDCGQNHSDNLEQQHARGENLETHQEEDWVVVKAADKENSGHLANHPYRSQHACHHHHHHVQTHHSQSLFFGGHDSLSQNSSTSSEAELLDDANALAQSISTSNIFLPPADMDDFSESVISPFHDYGWVNQDVDKYSDTDSLPESVFSVCSGRSHATYHPCGIQSEPWVVAPPPCFTGSQAGGTSPIASSPLENLLIEHPSMSVYLSFPPSHPVLSNHPTGIVVNPAAHPAPFLPHEVLKNVQVVQRMQCIQAKKLINRSKCECQNKVREYQGHAKGNNRRNKRMHPSGFKSSRFNQHM